MTQIKKVLIANRGEIAIRIMKTLSQMDIESVAIYAFDDSDALFIKEADEAYPLQGRKLSETYLDQKQILSIAKSTNCDAIHPGYGFLSENASFANACKKEGIVFIGPPVSAIELMGDKVASRRFAEQHNIPLLKGITGSHEELLAKKSELSYPVIIKASAGGGGKGMRVVNDPEDLEETLIATSREAESYFGNGEVFIERFIEEPRHIEVQVIGDQHGNLIHLYERECTIQRRHQKVIEEAPSISLTDAQRENVTATAIALAKAANYYSAGTIEFIVDEALNFYFMEMNTRIQVEHPVTELVTDVDIVEQQIKIAEGMALPFSQEDITIDGHAIECRIYAEDPAHNFRPSPGLITYYAQPEIEFTRIDTALLEPKVVSDRYDPMISKTITWGENRFTAIRHMREALDEYVIDGLPTNILFLKAVLDDDRYQNNEISTNYCKQYTEILLQNQQKDKEELDSTLPLLGFLHHDFLAGEANNSVWNEIGWYRQVKTIPISIEEHNIELKNFSSEENQLTFILKDQTHTSRLLDFDEKGLEFSYQGGIHYVDVHQLSSNRKIVVYGGQEWKIQRLDVLDDQLGISSNTSLVKNPNQVTSPIPGRVIELAVNKGDEVKEGQTLIVVEAMKMENSFKAPRDGVVQFIHTNPNEKVKAGQILIELETN